MPCRHKQHYAFGIIQIMYYLKTETAFDSAHFLKNYPGKCSNLHGHRWRVVVSIASGQLATDEQNGGMLVDFSDLKASLKKEADFFDHSLIIEQDSLKPETKNALLSEGFCIREVPFRPTAENFSRYFFEQMQKQGFPVYEAIVYETPNNCAFYREN